MPTDAPHLPERYADARLVARGGMGEVWHARDTRLDRDVAIKLLSLGDGLESEATRRERFHRETRAIAQLSTHPGVVTIYDEGEIDGQPFQSMEWMPGGTLAERIAADDLREHELFDALERVAGALDAAHAVGIVHRDVKPGNVMFDAEGRARIGDFGIARRAGDPSVTLTQVGAVVGTAGYIAPEQAQASGAVPESDQYALMSIAFQALTRRRPFARDSAIAELAAHVGDPVPAASSLDPRLPTSVDRVFDRALAKAPHDRYASCSAAVQALRDALEPVAPTVPVAAVAPRRRAATVAPTRTRRWPILLAVIAFAVIAAVAVASAGDEPTAKDDVRDTAAEAPAQTTTAKPEPEPEPEPVRPTEVVDAPTDAEKRDAAIAMHEESFRALQAGDYQRALDLALTALPDLAGVSPYEAYANYNAGAALVALGRCDEAMSYLDRSEQLQGQRDEIDAARESCSGSQGKGKGRKAQKDDD